MESTAKPIGLECDLLRILGTFTGPVSLDTIVRYTQEPRCVVLGVLSASHAHGLMLKTWNGTEDLWSISPQGAALLAAEKLDPVEIRRCPPRSLATVCISEGSLNDWWNEQDVEVKADAFLLWTLGSTSFPEDDEEDEPEIPIVGTVGPAPKPRTEHVNLADLETQPAAEAVK
jgi:hypothetical protein